jgi:hypothetical protein
MACPANGTSLRIVANPNNIGTTSSVLNIGQQKAASSRFLNGDIAKILIYNTNLSTGNRQGVESYLAQKWGIPTPTNRGTVGAGLRTAA